MDKYELEAEYNRVCDKLKCMWTSYGRLLITGEI